MSIYISNALYLSDSSILARRNRPLIGYNSVLRTVDFSTPNSADNVNDSIYNLWSADTYQYWRSANISSTSEINRYIYLRNFGNESVDYVGLVGHNFADFNTTYTVQYSYDGGDYFNLTDPKIPGTNGAIMEFFDSIAAGYFRIKLTHPATTEGDLFFKCTHIKLGAILRLQRSIWGGVTPMTMAKVVDGVTSKSDNGNFLGITITTESLEWELSQKNNDPDFVRQYIIPFIAHMNGTLPNNETPQFTFFAAWRPDDYPAEVVYGWKDPSQNVHPKNQNNIFMEWSCRGKAVI